MEKKTNNKQRHRKFDVQFKQEGLKQSGCRGSGTATETVWERNTATGSIAKLL